MKPATCKNYLAAIHKTQKALGICGDDAVALKQTVTGVQSARDMTEQQRRRYLAHLSGLQAKQALDRGEKPAYTPKRNPLYRTVDDDMDERWGKARALWNALGLAGIVHNNTDAALMAWVKRQTHLEHWRFLNTYQVTKVIEALKKWCDDKGVATDPATRS